MDVVQYPPGNHRTERSGILELLELDAPVERPGRRVGVDCEHVVATVGQRARDAPSPPAADLEHTCRRRGKVGDYVVIEAQDA